MEESNEQAVNPFAYATLFEHFGFTKDEKQDPERLKKISEVWDMANATAQRFNTSPMHEITVIERRLGAKFEVDKLNEVHRYFVLLSNMGDTTDELRSMEV